MSEPVTPLDAAPARRAPTATSAFGVSRRENHDASGFYARFTPPELSNDSTVNARKGIDEVFCGDARDMAEVPDASVALVVTSPPYFAGKEYEEDLGEGAVPGTYLDYLQMLTDVFAECVRTLEPGGRIAVNVANLGRKPYRSLSADVIRILQDELRLLLRGEVIWKKGDGATGSCAWGSFQRPTNPVLRDLTERVVIASKGRFDRAIPARKRHDQGLPSDATIGREEFMEATTDVWELPPENATRVQHPAPFPVELPERLIRLYTYQHDLVVDPFIGSGTTAIAAIRTKRHYAGYDLDEGYVATARARIREELRRRFDEPESFQQGVLIPAVPDPAPDDEDFQRRAVREGRAARELAARVLEWSGFREIDTDVRFPGGVTANFAARDAHGTRWVFDVSGAFTSSRAGLRRTDTLWKALGRAALLHQFDARLRIVLLTTDLPPAGSKGAEALRVACEGGILADAIQLRSPEDQERLRQYAVG